MTMGTQQALTARPDSDTALDFDAIVIGAGITGMYQLYRLRELGMRVRVIEAGTDIGGTWYWNRYPGARFDSESWSYGYSFSEELLTEWSWREHFSAQPDTLRYLQLVADKFDLRRDMQFGHSVTAAHFDDPTSSWTVTLDDGQKLRARFLFAALGPLSTHTLPRIPGLGSFQGPAFHTARWPREPLSLAGKRVGIIGTGATAVQTIQTIAKEVGHLTVLQRTPNWCAPLHNSEITPEEQEKIRARYPEIFERCRQTVSHFIHNPDRRKALETPPEEREAFLEKLYSEPGFGIWMGNFRDMLTNPEANAVISDFVARKIRQRVKDPRTAEKLIPKNHGFGTRRVPLETNYYEVYNQPNVELVDLNETPIACITPKGLKTSEREYEFDVLIYATGFDAVTGSYDRIDIRGPGGRSLKQDWEATPRTFMGFQPEGYPNFFSVMGPHTARGNIPRSSEHAVEWISELMRYMRENDLTRVEPRPEAVAEYTALVEKLASVLLGSKVDSWMTGINHNVEGRTVRRVLGYNGSAVKYREMAEKVATGGYREFIFDEGDETLARMG
jgi:cation diffusion facilitator CzcD-associated flavoprotein CzcO